MARYSLFVLKVPLNTNQPTFCKKALSDFDETWDVYWYYGLVVWSVKFSL